MIEDPGSFSGIATSPIPQRAPEASPRTSLAIFISDPAQVAKAPLANTSSSCAESAANLRDGLRLVQLEEPAHALGFRRRGLHLGAHAGGVSLEIFVKEAGEFFRGGLVGSFVGPRI